MQTWVITLPYERPPLNLNQRHHWTVRSRITKQIREQGGWLMRAAHIPPLRNATVGLNWTVPDRRRRDTDNPILTLKPLADAMVDAGILPDDTPEFVTKRETFIVYSKGLRMVQLVIEGEPWTTATS